METNYVTCGLHSASFSQIRIQQTCRTRNPCWCHLQCTCASWMSASAHPGELKPKIGTPPGI
eukprot:408413-Amphidinium_carterae.1